jgi:hypothetical protein
MFWSDVLHVLSSLEMDAVGSSDMFVFAHQTYSVTYLKTLFFMFMCSIVRTRKFVHLNYITQVILQNME